MLSPLEKEKEMASQPFLQGFCCKRNYPNCERPDIDARDLGVPAISARIKFSIVVQTTERVDKTGAVTIGSLD